MRLRSRLESWGFLSTRKSAFESSLELQLPLILSNQFGLRENPGSLLTRPENRNLMALTDPAISWGVRMRPGGARLPMRESMHAGERVLNVEVSI